MTDAARVVAEGLRFPEGPVALPDGSLLVVEIAGGALTRVRPDGVPEVVAELGGGPNGAAVTDDGRVVVCNSGGWVYERRGELTWPVGQSADDGWIDLVDLATGGHQVLHRAAGDVPLRSPNDVVLDGHGGFWFTDLGVRSPRHLDWTGVFYATLDGERCEEVIHPVLTPNGIGLSADGTSLFVAETFTGRLWSFDVVAPGRVAPGSGFAPHGGRLVLGADGYRLFDSLAVAPNGDVCVATLFESGITIARPSGGEVGFVPLPDPYTTNLCFAAPDRVVVTQSSSGRLVELPWPPPGLQERP